MFADKKVQYQPTYNQFLVSPFDLRDDVFRALLTAIQDFKTQAIWGYPSAITAFAQWVAATGPHPELSHLRAVLLASEGAMDWQLDLIREVFSVRIVRWYGQGEKVAFAAGCEGGKGYHVLPSYGFVEVSGEHVVGTGFTNHAMTLLRYDTEDSADLGPGPCPCGLPFSTLSQVRGRWDQSVLWGGDDEAISSTALNFHDRVFERFGRVQFRQDEKGVAALLVVAPVGESADDVALRRAVSLLQNRVGASLKIQASTWDQASC